MLTIQYLQKMQTCTENNEYKNIKGYINMVSNNDKKKKQYYLSYSNSRINVQNSTFFVVFDIYIRINITSPIMVCGVTLYDGRMDFI